MSDDFDIAIKPHNTRTMPVHVYKVKKEFLLNSLNQLNAELAQETNPDAIESINYKIAAVRICLMNIEAKVMNEIEYVE